LVVVGGFSRSGKMALRFNNGGGMKATAYKIHLQYMLREPRNNRTQRMETTICHDQARSHVAKIIKPYIEQFMRHNCEVLLSPTKSPDFAPIELYWNAMEIRVAAKRA
jgi:transposase